MLKILDASLIQKCLKKRRPNKNEFTLQPSPKTSHIKSQNIWNTFWNSLFQIPSINNPTIKRPNKNEFTSSQASPKTPQIKC